MELLSSLMKDLIIIGIIASFFELLLPRSEIHRPVKLVFGLYFMALMLNPLVSFFYDTDLSDIDFEILAEEKIKETEFEYSEDIVYEEAAKTLSREIEEKLGALYHDDKISVSIRMNTEGFQKVEIKMSPSDQSEVANAAEIKDFLASEYGISGNIVSFSVGKG